MVIRKKTETAAASDKRLRGARAESDASGAAAAAAAAQTEAKTQLNALEQGLRLFREGRFSEAKQWLEKAAGGPESTVRRTAQTHLNVSERRTQKPVLNLVSADDHYNYGVERLNARDIETARKHLQIALALRPGVEYMLYALAGTLALAGDLSGAFENLRRAIEVEPRNRGLARHDPDFASVIHNPLFAHLLYPEKNL